MLQKKALIISTFLILSCGYSQAAEACQAKFGSAAFGNLEKKDLDELKQRYRNTSIGLKRSNILKVSTVQSILGFSGEQTKTASNGKIEHRIWIDRDNCKRKIKASFMDRKLVKIKSYGF